MRPSSHTAVRSATRRRPRGGERYFRITTHGPRRGAKTLVLCRESCNPRRAVVVCRVIKAHPAPMTTSRMRLARLIQGAPSLITQVSPLLARLGMGEALGRLGGAAAAHAP